MFLKFCQKKLYLFIFYFKKTLLKLKIIFKINARRTLKQISKESLFLFFKILQITKFFKISRSKFVKYLFNRRPRCFDQVFSS